jgi:hypothetical protein
MSKVKGILFLASGCDILNLVILSPEVEDLAQVK